MLNDVIRYIAENQEKYLSSLARHIQIDAIVLVICIAVAVPLGYICAKNKVLAAVFLNLANLLKIIPTIAKFLILIPFLGLGIKPAMIALVLLAIPTIMINTMTGIQSVGEQVLESAKGMGMGWLKTCFSIEIPLAGSYILNGIRMAVIEVVAGTTVASYVGAGGLGDFIVTGLSINNSVMMYTGALTAALISVTLDWIIHYFQKRLERRIIGV